MMEANFAWANLPGGQCVHFTVKKNCKREDVRDEPPPLGGELTTPKLFCQGHEATSRDQSGLFGPQKKYFMLHGKTRDTQERGDVGQKFLGGHLPRGVYVPKPQSVFVIK